MAQERREAQDASESEGWEQQLQNIQQRAQQMQQELDEEISKARERDRQRLAELRNFADSLRELDD